MPETSSSARKSISAINLADHLPLTLLRSEIVPPSPNPYASSIDWLPDFAGYSWLAYGASTLLVISHLPSPLYHEKTIIGPFFRQVFELSGDSSSDVVSVSWSPVTPSVGELAAASGNRIFVFTHNMIRSNGSFCWSQNVTLVQSTKVEAIEWTGSGDGIVAGGNEVVLWRRRNQFWEIAWKFKGDEPQNLVSSTWSVEGLIATATSWSRHKIACKEVSKCVFVFYNDGKSGYQKVVLHHPQPILMIQWRQQNRRQSARDVKQSSRSILLTCCLDGTVRLWSEINDGKVRKVGKEADDQKTTKRSFCVAAVIEVNQALNGVLGSDISLTWATEVEGMLKTTKGTTEFFSLEAYKHEKTGACEWLIGFGPGQLVTLWAIHCLDDSSPVRFPRVTLWRRQELQPIRGLANSVDQSLIGKVAMLRNSCSGPPVACSLMHILPHNKLVWSLLYTKTSSETQHMHDEFRSESSSPALAQKVLDMGSHNGEILQATFHPDISVIELVASLDSNGLVLLWSVSTTSGCALDLSTPAPTGKLRGKLLHQVSHSKYTSISWAPPTFEGERVLLMGHSSGIDCFLLKIEQSDENDVAFNYICTIPVMGRESFEDGPTKIFSIPLPPSCSGAFEPDRFMLLGLWMKEFHALSWEVTLHSYDNLSSGCKSDFDYTNSAESGGQIFEKTFSGKRYLIAVKAFSSDIPEAHLVDSVTSFDVICPSWSAMDKKIFRKNPAYTMAIGHSDGTLKLWKHSCQKQPTNSNPWQLVGMLTMHHGPICAISLSDSGQKIAAICSESNSSTVNIWDTVDLNDKGIFMLEDSISLDGNITAIKWSALGNGDMLLGICKQHEVRIYAQQRCSGHSLLNSDKSAEAPIWYCIASLPTISCIRGFLWGPKGMAVILHENYFSLHSEWLFIVDKNEQANNHSLPIEDAVNEDVVNREGAIGETITTLTELEESLSKFGCPSHLPFPSAMENVKNGSVHSIGFLKMFDVAEKLKAPWPLYHPQALLTNIYSGNWKRAFASVQNLVEYLTSSGAYGGSQGPELVHVVPEMLLSEYLEECLVNSLHNKDFHWSVGTGLMETSSNIQRGVVQPAYNKEPGAFSNVPCSANNELTLDALQKSCDIGLITCTEKIQILAILDLLTEVGNTHSDSIYGNLDDPGRRFWVAFRFQQLHFARRWERPASLAELVIHSEMVAWALHSDCQETLFSFLLPSDPSWQEMKSMGIGFWYKNVAQLRSRMEKLARQQYLKNKSPRDCALLYIALNRVQVLAGLFKISKDEKDKPVVGFLSRNFQEEKNKAAALKNAYILMGKHQLEMAIAFFLLGGDMSSAISVCVKNLRDEQLALVICRLVEGKAGQLEHDLITKHMLPSAIEKGDYWLASALEWELGNYSKSYLTMTGVQGQSSSKTSVYSSNHVAFKDPSIGLYCLMLANRNNMKNAIGEHNAATFSGWAAVMAATAFNRCGLPLEALEHSSHSASSFGDKFHGCIYSSNSIRYGIPEDPANLTSNWISGGVASSLDCNARLELALQYFSKLLREHPCWPDTVVGPNGHMAILKETDIYQYEKLLKSFQHKLNIALDEFDRRFSLMSSCIISKILAALSSNGLQFIGYSILHEGNFSGSKEDGCRASDNRFFNVAVMQSSILKSSEDISLSLFRFAVACSTTCLFSESHESETEVSCGVTSKGLDTARNFAQAIVLSFSHFRASLRVCWGFCGEDQIKTLITLLDILEYYIQLTVTWAQRDAGCLFLMLQLIMAMSIHGDGPCEIDTLNLKKILQHRRVDTQTKSDVGVESQISKYVEDNHDANAKFSIPEDERWLIIGVCVWKRVSKFIEKALLSLSLEHDVDLESVFDKKPWPQVSNCQGCEHENESMPGIRLLILFMAKLLKATLAHVTSNHVKRLASLLKQKVGSGSHIPTLFWLEEHGLSQSSSLSQHPDVEVMEMEDNSLVSDLLWNLCVDPNIIYISFQQEGIDFSGWFNHKSYRRWDDMYQGIKEQNENNEPCIHESRNGYAFDSHEVGSPTSKTILSSLKKDANIKEKATRFHYPKEICKRNGELLEALCLNPIDQRQAAIASNRKGIIFFNWENEAYFADQSDYIWEDADWPHNGWAGSESTPLPTYVSLGIGLGSKRGAHLGLGGATVGMVSLARPRRDMTGAGLSGVPDYAGIGTSGLGWETQEDFEQFVDPPPTIETISTRAFSSHPGRPLFLVGSSNTHIYLWEFGKDRATATYGVLPAANVPPPYALASISAVQFGPCGHRFASAALDGTLCTWQLEVGGRSNIHPIESSLCFNSHASDVSYITSSGSIVAAAGYSTSGVNVIMWDTLAPPTTSQASIVCHEGGARSISVFDNDIGSGSVSPLIVTGGKNGDVGLHDFRYIATGKTKRHRQIGNREPTTGASSTTEMQNANGMLWHIPKAHIGSVTKISTIPNTSLFLTGSKDGDVKLWDAKAAKLIHHWPKLHERHTFLQPSSRGYGGIIRAGVTDIQLCLDGFLSCGGDGTVKLVQLKEQMQER